MPSARLLLVLGCVFLAGCATLDEDECRTADWAQIGHADGRAGHSRARLEAHREACAKLGIRPDAERYFAARERGLERYCTPENGWRVGRSGDSYEDVCPPELERAFLARYRAGREIHEARQRVDRLENERAELERRLDKAKSDEQRRELRDQLRRNDRRLSIERDSLMLLESRQR